MISVICCYNDKSVYDQMLKKSLRDQNVDCELIGIDNRERRFSSAACALNYGVTCATGDHLIFVHQDIEFAIDSFVSVLVQHMAELEDCIVGIAGKKDASGVYTNITHVKRDRYAGEYRVKEPLEMQTLDECLIAMKKETYNKIQFDEVVCNDWHLYAADLCLSAKMKGIRSIVVPLRAHHASSGQLSNGYWSTMDNLVIKHRRHYKNIFTTCSNVGTGIIKYSYLRLRLGVKDNLQRLLMR